MMVRGASWRERAAAFVAILLLSVVLSPVAAKTWYVRADGGTPAKCNGEADAPASASPACAWSSPTFALPMGTSDYGGVIPKARIRPGDTLRLGAGSYMVGIRAPGYVKTGSCYPGAPYECSIASIPSGIDAAHPTVIQGDCSAKTELWGMGALHGVLWLRNVHDIRIECLGITDHSVCITNYGPTTATGGVVPCIKNAEDPYAMYGIEAVNVTNLSLAHVDIHGLSQYGLVVGQLHGQTRFDDVTIRANGWGGWNGDLSGEGFDDSGDDGTLAFKNLVVAWNGCAEAYPTTKIVGCWGQSNGGYGDGFGTNATGGDWVFDNARFYQNTSDGLDLLYHSRGGTITINGGVFWGNIGNQIKVAGDATISRAVVNGFCNNFAAYPVGGAQGNSANNCRAAGTAVVMVQNESGQTSLIRYSTITGDGDTLLVGKGDEDRHGNQYTPVASNVWRYENNIFLGQPSAYRQGHLTALDWYSDGAFGGTVRYANNIVWNVKRGYCPATSVCKDPKLRNATLEHFDPALLPGSPAVGAARPVPGAPNAWPDIGAAQPDSVK